MFKEKTFMYVAEIERKRKLINIVFKNLLKKPILLIRSSLIGIFIGMLPGAGGNISSLISYNEAKRWSKESDKFGKGVIDGVVAQKLLIIQQ